MGKPKEYTVMDETTCGNPFRLFEVTEDGLLEKF